MEEESYQKELFEFEGAKKQTPRFSIKLPGGDFFYPLTLEKLIFGAIGIVMALVIVFACGVERGKTIERQRLQRPVVAHATPAARPVAPAPVRTPTAPQQQPAVPPSTIATGRSFTIVAGSFTRKDTAMAAMQHLKKEGNDAFMLPSGTYYQVCVGNYQTREQALKSLIKVKRIYVDSYIKQR